MTEVEWHAMMRGVVAESRRVLAPRGSAVYILQPNSERVGRMRPWLWEFMAWTAREWNMVQDAWWWNISALPVGGCNTGGLMRPSLKACIWLGPPDCYRDQGSVLQVESAANLGYRLKENFGDRECPSRRRSASEGPRDNYRRMRTACVDRGGTVPFNVLPFGSDGRWNGGTHGHGASTPFNLCDWWTRYITRPDDVVLDPFAGSGTTGLAAWKRRRRFIGIERDEGYFRVARSRLAALQASVPLLAGLEASA
jgi:hypothetical protein